MIKKVLLAGSVLSLAVAANAAEKEFYVIKDGKMVNCEFVKGAAADDMQTIIKESKNDAGEDMVEIINPVEKYTSGWVYLPEAIDLNKAWNLEVEYYFNKDVAFSGENIKREGLSFDLMADTASMGNVSWATNRSQLEYRIAHVSIDCTWRDFIDYDAATGDTTWNRFGVGQLRSVKKYVYSSLMMPAKVAERGDANQVKAIFMSIFPEGGVQASCFIKNLKFVSDGTKPFYAEKFTALSNEGTIYSGIIANYVYGTYAGNADIQKQAKSKKYPGFSPNETYGMQSMLAESKDPYYSNLGQDRMYCEKGEQRGAGFYDTEYGMLPYFPATSKHSRVDEEGVEADAILRIPLGEGAVDKVISIAMRLGHNAGETGDLTPYADYKANSKDVRFPVEYRFEKGGDATKIGTTTDWVKFTPSYTKGGADKIDSIPTEMSMVYGDVELPSKEYNYITLRFVSNDIISYMFTDLTLTGDKNAWVTDCKNLNLQKDFADYMIPVNPVAPVENVIAKGEVSIYPNPATDVITVANEGVKSVAVYTVAGSLVAASESNTVNVANLANGIYVVKANTEAGVITGQIIKK